MNKIIKTLEELKDCNNVLDLCAGPGYMLRDFKGQKIGIELNSDYKTSLENNGYKVFIENVLDFNIETIDATIMIDGIEHLTKEDGLKLLEKIESYTTKKIIIFTPDGFYDNHHSAMALDESLQEHLSAWPKEFWLDNGYKIIFREHINGSEMDNILYVKDVTGKE